MNAKGLTGVLRGMSIRVRKPYFERLVEDGHIKQDELDGTRQLAASVHASLEQTPTDQMEDLVAQYNDRLQECWGRFVDRATGDELGMWRDTQIMLGHVSTMLTEADIGIDMPNTVIT